MFVTYCSAFNASVSPVSPTMNRPSRVERYSLRAASVPPL